MMMLKFVIISSFLFFLSNANFTKVSRKNLFLSRRKRYLIFPMGSSLVITLSITKPLLRPQPTGWNTVMEMDFPFGLPPDTRFLENKKMHYKERRDVYSKLDLGFTGNGLNGTACVKRMICDTQKYVMTKGKSLARDLLLAIFTPSDEDSDMYHDIDCDKAGWMECPVPLIESILRSVEYN